VVLPLDGRAWPIHSELRDAGVVILPAPSRSSLLTQTHAVRAAVRRFRPNIVHSCLWRADLISRLATPRRLPVLVSAVNTQYSVQARAHAPSPRRLEVLRLLDHALAHRPGAHLHAITQAVAVESAAALGVRPEEVIVVPRGRGGAALHPASSTERRVTRERLGVPADSPLIVNVARHEWQKGPEALVDVFASVAARHPQAVLVQAGREGTATDALRRRIEHNGLDGHQVRLIGVRDDIPEIVAASDVFLFTSAWEGLGGSVLEAMAVGTPVASFAVPAVVEILGGRGLTAALGDVPALAACVSALIEDPGLARQVGQEARARFLDHFTIEAVAEAMVRMYAEVLRRQGRDCVLGQPA
jgi:glycosyltransferase involved in cell wall biosynthesis